MSTRPTRRENQPPQLDVRTVEKSVFGPILHPLLVRERLSHLLPFCLLYCFKIMNLTALLFWNVATLGDSLRTTWLPIIQDSGRFALEGADHPGIVHRVTTILAQNGLSIDKMETSDEIAPHGGTTLFKMRGIANAAAPLASGFDVQKIREQLSDLGNKMNCDITLENA